jgi:hypothetical protein
MLTRLCTKKVFTLVSEPEAVEIVWKLWVSAPKARNVKAWAIGPGGRLKIFVALKARNVAGGFIVTTIF